jgi:hypothetical protein
MSNPIWIIVFKGFQNELFDIFNEKELLKILIELFVPNIPVSVQSLGKIVLFQLMMRFFSTIGDLNKMIQEKLSQGTVYRLIHMNRDLSDEKFNDCDMRITLKGKNTVYLTIRGHGD